MNILMDRQGRILSYLRLSLTEVCNFRCRYCLPQGYRPKASTGRPFEDTVLSALEIERLIRAFAGLGFKKVRLTGGEPALRPDLLEIIGRVAAVPGIEKTALTTNGFNLAEKADALRAAGLNAVNISVDSLERERFEKITGSSCFERVQAGIQSALGAGFEEVKLNVVLLRSSIAEDLPQFLGLLRSAPVSLRFIELMQTGDNGDYFRQEYVSGEELLTKFAADGWIMEERSAQDGPARVFCHSGYQGRIGLIAPYSKDFCSSCNRLRVSSRGKLRLCLFGEGEYSLRSLLQHDEQCSELKDTVRQLISGKGTAHHLHEGVSGDTQSLAAIGG